VGLFKLNTMKMAFLLAWSFVTLHAADAEQAGNTPARRISAAEVETVRLEVEQTNFDKDIQIRVRDYTASGVKREAIACEIRSVNGAGKERKVRAVLLKRGSNTAFDFHGSFLSEDDFPHGSMVRVIYRSDALKLPVSTWLTLYYR
jgi:hypothetical protein